MDRLDLARALPHLRPGIILVALLEAGGAGSYARDVSIVAGRSPRGLKQTEPVTRPGRTVNVVDSVRGRPEPVEGSNHGRNQLFWTFPNARTPLRAATRDQGERSLSKSARLCDEPESRLLLSPTPGM